MAAQFSYFTTSDDLREIVKQVDANTQFQYIEYKNFSESEYPNARMYDSLLEYPHLGYARSAQCRGDMFLALNRCGDGRHYTPGFRPVLGRILSA